MLVILDSWYAVASAMLTARAGKPAPDPDPGDEGGVLRLLGVELDGAPTDGGGAALRVGQRPEALAYGDPDADDHGERRDPDDHLPPQGHA